MAHVQIYTTRICPYCLAVKALLRKKGVKYEEIDVSGDAAKRLWLSETTGQRTVPQIFIDGRCYGGYSDLAALDKQGALDVLLSKT